MSADSVDESFSVDIYSRSQSQETHARRLPRYSWPYSDFIVFATLCISTALLPEHPVLLGSIDRSESWPSILLFPTGEEGIILKSLPFSDFEAQNGSL